MRVASSLEDPPVLFYVKIEKGKGRRKETHLFETHAPDALDTTPNTCQADDLVLGEGHPPEKKLLRHERRVLLPIPAAASCMPASSFAVDHLAITLTA